MITATKIFKALSDPNRLKILKALQSRTLCVCEIREILQLANSTVSEHLRLLKETGFIIEDKEGKWVNYLINPHPSDPRIIAFLTRLEFWIGDDKTVALDRDLLKVINRAVICC